MDTFNIWRWWVVFAVHHIYIYTYFEGGPGRHGTRFIETEVCVVKIVRCAQGAPGSFWCISGWSHKKDQLMAIQLSNQKFRRCLETKTAKLLEFTGLSYRPKHKIRTTKAIGMMYNFTFFCRISHRAQKNIVSLLPQYLDFSPKKRQVVVFGCGRPEKNAFRGSLISQLLYVYAPPSREIFLLIRGNMSWQGIP